MVWLLLTFFAILFRAVYGLMTKVLSNKAEVSVYTQAMLLSLSGVVLSIAITPIFGLPNLDFSGVSMVAVALVGLSQGFGNIVYFSAIRHLTNGTAQITFSSILVFNTALSVVFLDLNLSFMNFIGVLLLLVAILSVVNGKVAFNSEGILLMTFAAFLFAVFQLSSSELSRQVGTSTYLLIAYLGSVVTIFLTKTKTIITDIKSKSIRKIAKVPMLTALPSVANFTFAYYAYREAPEPAKVAMLLTAQVVLTVIISYIFLKEHDHLWRKLFAATLVILSAILIRS